MPDYGIKISRTGKDVFTTDDFGLLINSSKDSYKFLKKDKSTLTTDGSGNASLTQETQIPYPTVFDSFIKLTAVNPSNHTDTLGNCYFRQTRQLNLNAWQQDPLDNGGGGNGNFRAAHQGRNIYYEMFQAAPSTTYEVTSVFLLPSLRAVSTIENLSFFEDYGLKISKDNIDVFKAKPHEIFLSNSYVPAPVVAEREMQLDLPDLVGDNAEQTIYADFEHKLGFAPFFIGFTRSVNQDGNIWRPIPRPIFSGSTNNNLYSAEIFVTDNIARVSVWRNNLVDAFNNVDWDADTQYFHFFLFDIPLNVI